ncbi:MAG: transposase [Candidatus Woesearchaeota archaeon]
MQRTIKVKLNPTQKKKDELLSTMGVYKETVNKFITRFSGCRYLDKLNYKCLYKPENKDTRIASNYSTNALAYAVTLLNNRLDLIRKGCKAKIYNHIKDKEERHYLFYLLKQPKYIKTVMSGKKVAVDKEFNLTRTEYLNKYLHRILRHGFKNNNLPKLKKPLLRTDVVTAKIEQYKNSKQFSYVLKISTINKGKRVIIPFNPNKWAQKFFNKRKGCFIVYLDEQGNFNLHLPIEEEIRESNNTQEIGVDKGFRTLLVDSNKQMYGEKWNDLEKKLDDKFQKKQKQRNKLYGLKKELHKKWTETKDKKVYKKIKHLEKYNLGKKKFNQSKRKAKDTIKNNVNLAVNRLVSKNPKLKIVVLEKLDRFDNGKKYSKRSNRLLNQWKRGFLKEKLTFISQLNSIELAYQNRAYTSQLCPNCGYVHRDNRHSEEFTCFMCEYSEHADVVGALNILRRKNDSEIGLYTPYKKVKEILLQRYSVGAIKPPRLETLNLNGCESYKQSIQERNITLVTGGESSLSST